MDTQTQSEVKRSTKYWHETSCAVCESKFWSRIKHNQKTCSAKCSGIYVARDPNRVAKIKATKLVKYGSETYVNPEKARETCLKKYGVDNASKSQGVIDSIKSTNQLKYGVDWSFQSESTKEKIKLHNLINFNVEHVSQREDVKEAKKKTCVDKYGVENPFQSPEIKNRITQHYLDTCGVSHPSQTLRAKKIKREKFIDTFFSLLVADHKYTENCIPMFTKEEYINSDKIHIYKFKCKKCGDIFLDHIDCHIPRCLKCNPIGISIIEGEVLKYVESLTSSTITKNSRSILPSGLELDIYVPDKQIAIEFDGLYFHSEATGKDRKYHLSKTEECEKLGIHLIHVFEDEWLNKQEIVKAKIASKFIREKSIGARQLTIKQIDFKQTKEFLEKYHIQGSTNSSMRYGGFYKNELVCVATFSKERIALGNKNTNHGTYELVRFATSIPVVGALQKIIKILKVDYAATNLISFADRRYTSVLKNIYASIGMVLEKITEPNYWYFFNGYYRRWHRFSFRKSELKSKLPIYDENLSEWSNMSANGYNRIWDCGNLKYTMKLV